MKRFVAVLAGLIALPAFAEVAPVFYEDVIEYVEEDVEPASVAADTGVSAPVVAPTARNARANGRATATGRVSGRNATSRTATRAGVVSRAARPTVVTRSGTLPTVASRAAATRAQGANGTDRITTTRRAMQTGGANVARAGVTTTDTVNNPIYSGNVAARVGMRVSSGTSGAVRARIPTISASVTNSTSSTTATTTNATAASTAAAMDEMAQMTSFCKAQYTECMDNFCNVLDDNQGRCSCSKNIKNYEKTEIALKEATEALQDVAQQIQYIGLSKDDITTLFSQTEAELQMQNSTDNSKLKNDLDKIRSLVVEVKSGTASSTEVASGLSMDLSGLLDFSIGSTGFDLGALFGNTSTANTNSISNQRGEQLYKTAASRCKAAILTDCQAQGVDISVVSNSYDLEIDKQCVAYERALTDANDEMNQTVRNAKSVLQRARLMVAQQKNAYDLRGCINALDSCMQDDYVCGNEYENCLDPTGKYIVNGEIVIGSTPGQAISNDTKVKDDCDPAKDSNCLSSGNVYSTTGLYSTWNYGSKNAWSGEGEESLAGYVDTQFEKYKDVEDSKDLLNKPSDDMLGYLMYKIGYIDDGKSYGMCSNVLNKCQAYTYENGKYNLDNRVVQEYMTRTMIQIKAAQDEMLADYAETCISDVSSCLGENGYDETKSDSNKSRIAINACRAQIMTCMSVNGNASGEPTPSAIKDWVTKVMSTDEETSGS